ncbi:MAG: hypothetical protein HC859_10730 [Bacteroidia bacterium]|nr:hypothetical protein [Bacteroidia bacterium]
MKTLLKLNLVKWAFIFSIALLTLGKSCTVHAQGLPMEKRKLCWGLEGSLGAKSFSLTSDLTQLDGVRMRQAGGSLGFVVGLSEVQLRPRLGFYYGEAGQTHSQWIDAGLDLQVYPRQLIRKQGKRFQPYIVSGLSRGTVKLDGMYSGEQTAPVPGKLIVTSLAAGAGFEFRFPQAMDFICLFSQLKYQVPLNYEASTSALNHTKVMQSMTLNVGISFGAIR